MSKGDNLKKYIVLVSGAIGGAEKRFFDIFKGLSLIDDDVYLVVPSCLINLIGKEEDLSKYLNKIIILDIPHWSPLSFAKKFYKSVLRKSDKEDYFHYPLSPLFFLHFFTRRKYGISFCDCHFLPKLSLRNKNASLQWLASFFAEKVDVLSPDILKLAGKELKHIENKASLTPGGTYIFPSDDIVVPKARKVIFISRLEPNKGVDVLFDILPLINQCLSANEKVTFHVYGEGSLAGFVKAQAEKYKNLGIDIEYHGYGVIDKILPDAWCVLSLQSVTNYPSRVVAEALLAGCEVIISDTGNSRDFGVGKGVSYLYSNYSNLSELTNEITQRSSYKNDGVIESIKADSIAKFSSPSYLNYMRSLLKAN